ncbi:MAG: hypothetical protein HQL76_12200 [Magnetococcales bacterium]|nr:hypothetical protein [Magnetococcales bacterium]
MSQLCKSPVLFILGCSNDGGKDPFQFFPGRGQRKQGKIGRCLEENMVGKGTTQGDGRIPFIVIGDITGEHLCVTWPIIFLTCVREGIFGLGKKYDHIGIDSVPDMASFFCNKILIIPPTVHIPPLRGGGLKQVDQLGL